MSICSDPPASAGFVSSVVRSFDCQAESFALGAWQALSLPGSTLSLVLGSFLTLFIAFIGYNLLLGTAFTVRSGTVALVKVGAVLALATSWPAYQILVYDVVTSGPSQLFAELAGTPADISADAALLARLDVADGALAQLAVLGPGYPGVATATSAGVQVVPPPFAGFNAFALGGARILFLLTATASLAIVRLVAALMLALGPLLVAFLLFDNTRSLFEGWVRVLAGAALAGLAARVAIALQLALLEPWLATVLVRRQADEALPTVPVELLVLVTLFALLALGLVIASARIARAFRMASLAQLVTVSERVIAGGEGVRVQSTAASPTTQTREVAGTRSTVSGGIIRSTEHRDAMQAARLARDPMRSPATSPALLKDARSSIHRTLPLGQSFRSSGRRRTATSSARRDAQA